MIIQISSILVLRPILFTTKINEMYQLQIM